MKVYGDIERVNLSTGERFRRVTGDGESRLVSCCCDHVSHIRLGPRAETLEEQMETAKRLEEILAAAARKLKYINP